MFIDFHVEWNGGGNRRVEVLTKVFEMEK